MYKYGELTHPPSNSFAYRTSGYLPNGWNRSWLYSPFGSPYMDCTGKTISFEMQWAQRHFRGCKHQKRSPKRFHLWELHRKLATMFRSDANMTSLPICLTSVNSFLIHSVIFESIYGGRRKPRNKVKITWLPVRICKIKIGMVSTQHFYFPKMKREGKAKFWS